MSFQIEFQPSAIEELECLQQTNAKKHKKVLKTLACMQSDLRHPSLNTHKYDEYVGPKGEDVFEAYVENATPGAYRVFWYYGPERGVITILAITPHP